MPQSFAVKVEQKPIWNVNPTIQSPASLLIKPPQPPSPGFLFEALSELSFIQPGGGNAHLTASILFSYFLRFNGSVAPSICLTKCLTISTLFWGAEKFCTKIERFHHDHIYLQMTLNISPHFKSFGFPMSLDKQIENQLLWSKMKNSNTQVGSTRWIQTEFSHEQSRRTWRTDYGTPRQEGHSDEEPSHVLLLKFVSRLFKIASHMNTNTLWGPFQLHNRFQIGFLCFEGDKIW